MIFGISNPIFTKTTKFWRILEIKKTPVNQNSGKYWNSRKDGALDLMHEAQR